MHWAGYFAASLIGISLGLIGGGGSILTIPVLVYLFGVQPLAATGYSLFIVGSTSLAGAIRNFRKGYVNMHTAIYFSIISTVTILITRKFLISIIPDNIIGIGSFQVTKSILMMLLFASVMLFAAVKMIKDKPIIATGKETRPPVSKIFFNAIRIGLLTGMLGAGGGFLIIPVLIFSFRLDVRSAIGTSLMIIALNNLFGFVGDIFHTDINWRLLLTITPVAVAGIYVGIALSHKIHGDKLRKGFGWFILLMGVYIIFHELYNVKPG